MPKGAVGAHQVGAPYFSLKLFQLPVSEGCNDLLQATGLDFSRHIVFQMPGSVCLLALAVGEHVGLVILSLANQVQSVQMLLLSLATKACSTAVTSLNMYVMLIIYISPYIPCEHRIYPYIDHIYDNCTQ